ncbi:hypothetical protein [Streptomyces sp. PA03-2a]|uniref:hypothetical protein n=1 Tax=Streptomyces sp. PA03-2a TaxID=3028701 RepID=UPI0029AEA0F1|nr:hypothetical protein [Streptomyces sp. PA03-2a]MDX2732914.1 hypothetical protein [Streptomyces sp. PA03-2a]
MGIADTSIAAAAAVFSGVAAFGAWKTANEANRTATSVAQIERDRWHTEMTPNVVLAVTNERGRPELLVRFDGPAPLGAIDVLELSIRDDRDRSNDQTLAGGATREERARTIWGPFRLSPHIDGADELGRSAKAFSLTHGEQRRFALESSWPPRWYEGVDGARRWESDFQSHALLRVWVVCHVEGHKPWKLTADLVTNGVTTEWVRAH